MATTIRGNSGGREKRGTSPSSSLTRKSPKPSSQNQSSASSSSPLAKEKILLTSDKKPVPSYLKSTTTGSKLDSTSKRLNTTLAQKPSPIRRRSFDRPPPTSELQRAIRSGPGTPREVKPNRSTSFSHRPGSSSLSPSSKRVVSGTYARTTSSLKDGKLDSNLSKTQSRKKSTVSPITPMTKKKGLNGLRSASSTSVTSESSIDHDDNDNTMIDQLGLEDDLVSMDIEVQSLPEMSEMPDSNQELGDPITFIDRDVKLFEDLQDDLTASEEQDLTVEGQTEVHTIDEHSEKESEEKDVIVEQQHPTVEEQHPTVEEQNLPVEEKHLIVEEHNPIVEERNMTFVEQPAIVEEKIPTPEEQNPIAEEQKLVAESDEDDKVAKNVEHGVTELAKEAKEEEKEAPAAKDENPNVKIQVPEPSKAQTSVGRKDKQAYNDVIEETASKLMGGKRRNKVLALAGAFETVISLQDTGRK